MGKTLADGGARIGLEVALPNHGSHPRASPALSALHLQGQLPEMHGHWLLEPEVAVIWTSPIAACIAWSSAAVTSPTVVSMPLSSLWMIKTLASR